MACYKSPQSTLFQRGAQVVAFFKRVAEQLMFYNLKNVPQYLSA